MHPQVVDEGALAVEPDIVVALGYQQFNELIFQLGFGLVGAGTICAELALGHDGGLAGGGDDVVGAHADISIKVSDLFLEYG